MCFVGRFDTFIGNYKGSTPVGGGGRTMSAPTPICERLCRQEKGQVQDPSLKTKRRGGASQKVLLPPFLSRKGGPRPKPGAFVFIA